MASYLGQTIPRKNKIRKKTMHVLQTWKFLGHWDFQIESASTVDHLHHETILQHPPTFQKHVESLANEGKNYKMKQLHLITKSTLDMFNCWLSYKIDYPWWHSRTWILVKENVCIPWTTGLQIIHKVFL